MTVNFKTAACMVLFVTFTDNNVRTFYSRDLDRQSGNTHYWHNHLLNLAEKKWPGKVKEFAIYRCLNGNTIGDPITKKALTHD